MCNLPMGAGGRRAYGQDALVAGPIHEYEVSPDYSPSPEQQGVLPYYENEEREYFYISFIDLSLEFLLDDIYRLRNNHDIIVI